MTQISSANVSCLVNPQSIAIVGASPNSHWTAALYRNLRESAFPGKLFLVNPNYREVWGEPCYPSLTQISDPVDQALIVIRAEFTPEILRAAVEKGCRSAILYSAGYAEQGTKEGKAREEALIEICRNGSIRVCGPNCMGLISFHDSVLVYPQKLPSSVRPGSVAMLFQSGGTLGAFIRSASDRGIGLSYAISTGNELDVDLADFLNFLVDDPHTRVILLLIEGLRRPQEFVRACQRALELGKPIVAVKIGRSEAGQRSTLTHTGVLAGADEAFNAVCRKYGVLRVTSLDELIETAEALSLGRLPAGRRVGIVVGSGALKGLTSDLAELYGLTLANLNQTTMNRLGEILAPGVIPGNPLDTGWAGGADDSTTFEAAQAFLDDPNVDLLLVNGELPRGDERNRRQPTRYRELLDRTVKSVFFFGRASYSVNDYGRRFHAELAAPFLQDAARSLFAIRNLINYAESHERGHTNTSFSVPQVELSSGVREFLKTRRMPFGIIENERLLSELSVPVVQASLVHSAEEAVDAATTMGFPVAVKVYGSNLTHKSEIGGVALALEDATSVERAYREILVRAQKAAVNAEVEGILIQRMILGGLETVLSFKMDPLYGPLVVFGLGGIFVEILNDVSLRLAPLNPDEATSMITELKGAMLFEGFRGTPRRDMRALIHCLVNFSHGVVGLKNVSSLEINPLIVLEEGKGVVAVDLVGLPA